MGSCAYYNTFFNAEKYFAEAQDTELRDDGRPQSSAIQKYNNAIKKCGIILTEYKDSKWADDALFMLARSLYYIGRNYTQSIEKFEDLINFYPESEFVPDAKIYIARANYEFRRQELAYELLKQFLLEEEYLEHHPKALKQLSDYHLLDKNYVEADYYLNQLIEKFPDSNEYTEAFFQKGKARHEAGSYKQSNDVFLALLNAPVPRHLKFDARYYIALNFLHLGDYDLARTYSEKLLKDEYRDAAIPRIILLKARSLAKTGKSEDAILLFESLLEDHKRSRLSAEAAFHLAEHYFEDLQNYEEAIQNYNKVKAEFAQSIYVEDALTRSSVASQIIQYNNPDSDLNAEELVLQQLKLAEFYFEVLAKPDSALIVYDNIIDHKNLLESKLDSLKLEYSSIRTKLDSVSRKEKLYIIALAKKHGYDDVADSLRSNLMIPVLTDSLQVGGIFDSLTFSKEWSADSLVLDSIFDLDSLAFKAEDENIKSLKDNLAADLITLEQLQDRTELDLQKFDEEFIPFAKFVKLWLFKTVINDSLKVEEIAADLQKNHPENKYNYAAQLLLAGEPVEITTAEEIAQQQEYQKAIDLLLAEDFQAIALLDSIAADSLHRFYPQANYSLGYINYLMLADSTAAKPYFETVLALENNSEYKAEVNKFYIDGEFKRYSRLPYLEQLEAARAKEEAEKQAKEEQESEEETGSEEKNKIEHKSEIPADSAQEDDLKKKSVQPLPPDEEITSQEIIETGKDSLDVTEPEKTEPSEDDKNGKFETENTLTDSLSEQKKEPEPADSTAISGKSTEEDNESASGQENSENSKN